MDIIAVDDEALALRSLENAIYTAIPEARVHCFHSPQDAENYFEKSTCQIAFLDVQLKGTTGINLARRLKEKNPFVNIIFSTGYSEYMSEAFDIPASGYLLKPITPFKVQEAIANLRYPLT